MGMFNEVETMFRGVRYNQFTSPQVRDAMTRKVEAVKTKIEERHRRVERIVADNGISPEALSDLIIQYTQDKDRGNHNKMSYSVGSSNAPTGGRGGSQETVVPAGVVANIAMEKGLIVSETAELKRLALILRNLKDTLPYVDEKLGSLVERPVIHTLDDTDIEYLGF